MWDLIRVTFLNASGLATQWSVDVIHPRQSVSECNLSYAIWPSVVQDDRRRKSVII